MKAVCIIGMAGAAYAKSARVIDAVNSTLSELGLSVSKLALMDLRLPFYESGPLSEGFLKLADQVKDSKNVIFIYNVTVGSPSAVMKIFLEYFASAEARSVFENKHVFNIAVSAGENTEEDGRERESAGYVAQIFEDLGAFEVTRLCISREALLMLESGEIPMDSVEKYAEDYYRLTRQNRIFLRPARSKPHSADEYPSSHKALLGLKNQVETSMRKTAQNAIPNTTPNATPNAMTPPQPKRIKKHTLERIESTEGFADENVNFVERRPHVPASTPVAPPLASPASTSVAAHATAPGIDYDAFNSRQMNDIEELTKLFATKIKSEDLLFDGGRQGAQGVQGGQGLQGNAPTTSYNPAPTRAAQDSYDAYGAYESGSDSGFAMPPQKAVKKKAPAKGAASDAEVSPRNKTCKQLTQSLPHYFQPQLANDTDALFQIMVSGEENFSGYLEIKNRENEYFEGRHETPDITIIADAGVWTDILMGKFSAQKAFMTGQLKVRGNFMLLNRFDQLYENM